MFLLEGHSAPDHATLARFRSIHFAPCSKRILAEVSNILFDLGEISGETIFIDGTKIEANANKYTFVWKKAVTKNQAKLLIKLADFVAECEQLYDIKIVYGNVVKIKHLKRLRKKLYALKDAEHNLKFKYKNITADAGYESEENYLFLEANNQIAFIKPANYEISKTRKYKNDIGKIENMEYDKISDFYTCKNNRKLTVSHIRHNKTKTGYVNEKTIYTCENCSDCNSNLKIVFL
jgi:transposase